MYEVDPDVCFTLVELHADNRGGDLRALACVLSPAHIQGRCGAVCTVRYSIQSRGVSGLGRTVFHTAGRSKHNRRQLECVGVPPTCLYVGRLLTCRFPRSSEVSA